VKFDEIEEGNEISRHQEFMNIERRFVDDFDIEYGGYELPELNNYNKCLHDILDIQEIRINAKKFLKSDTDAVSAQSGIVSLDSSMKGSDQMKQKEKKNEKFNLTLEVRKIMKLVLVENSLMKKLYPSLKIQKPGQEYYQQQVLTQIVICLFIVIFFSKMDLSNNDILEQASSNSYSGYMVYILLTQLVIMVIDRFIYKSRSFTEVKDKT